jgi:hypothetical protein
VKAVEAEPAKLKLQSVDRATENNDLSKEMQEALEAGNHRKAKSLCGGRCKSDPSGQIATGATGTRDYTCNGGNCACAGAVDCVAMTKICLPDTMGCNDYGCACKEKPEPEPDPGG